MISNAEKTTHGEEAIGNTALLQEHSVKPQAVFRDSPNFMENLEVIPVYLVSEDKVRVRYRFLYQAMSHFTSNHNTLTIHRLHVCQLCPHAVITAMLF